jgi:hypothetical protein
MPEGVTRGVGVEDTFYCILNDLAMTACFSCLKLSAIVAVYYGFIF